MTGVIEKDTARSLHFLHDRNGSGCFLQIFCANWKGELFRCQAYELTGKINIENNKTGDVVLFGFIWAGFQSSTIELFACISFLKNLGFKSHRFIPDWLVFTRNSAGVSSYQNTLWGCLGMLWRFNVMKLTFLCMIASWTIIPHCFGCHPRYKSWKVWLLFQPCVRNMSDGNLVGWSNYLSSTGHLTSLRRVRSLRPRDRKCCQAILATWNGKAVPSYIKGKGTRSCLASYSATKVPAFTNSS